MTELSASFVSTRPNLPVSQITVDGEVLEEVVPVEVTVSQAAGKHDSAELVVLWPSTNSAAIERKPVTFTFGRGRTSAVFRGYVYSVEKSQGFQKQVVTTITCLGLTWPMRTITPRMFSAAAGSAIAAEVVRPHQLGVTVDADDGYTFPRAAQVNETDWEFLHEMAHSMGMVLVSRDGVVRLVNPIAALSKGTPSRNLTKTTNLLDDPDSNLFEFTPLATVTTERRFLRPTFGYFGSDHSVRTHVPDAEAADVVQALHRVVPDSSTADHLIKTSARWNDYNETADARVRGDGGLGPGDTVAVRTGIPAVVDNYDGMWFVMAASHKVDSKTFQTSLRLSRDAYRRPSDTQAVRPYWIGDDRLFPTTSLANGRWVSSWR